MTFTVQLGWFYQRLHFAVPVEPAMNYQLHISLTIVHWCFQPLKWLVSTRKIKNSFLSTLINYPWLWLKRKEVLIILISCLDLFFQLFCFCWRKTIGFIRDGLNEFFLNPQEKRFSGESAFAHLTPRLKVLFFFFFRQKATNVWVSPNRLSTQLPFSSLLSVCSRPPCDVGEGVNELMASTLGYNHC